MNHILDCLLLIRTLFNNVVVRSALPTPPRHVHTRLHTQTFQLNLAVLSRFQFTDNEDGRPGRGRGMGGGRK